MRKRCILITVQYENEKRCIFSKEKWNDNFRFLIWRNIYIKERDEPISFEQIEIRIFLLYDLEVFD